jgi:thiol-disulfide isomerase/thioredoxin
VPVLVGRCVCLLLLAAASPAFAETVSELVQRHRGQIVVLNFWASWCQPCQREIPALVRLQRDHGPRGVRVLGASIDEPSEQAAAKDLAKQMAVNYPVVYDASTEDMQALGLATAIPATAIFDQEGRRAFRIIGEATEADLTSRVAWLLGDRVAQAPVELVLPAGVTPEHFAEHERGDRSDEEHDDEHQAEEGGSAVPT